jgi:acyl carrier protein
VNRAEILTKVGESIDSVLGQPDLVITMRTTAQDVEGWDSFNHVNIVVAIESQFGIKFNTAEVEQLRAVGEFVKLIEEKLAKKRK